MQKGSHKDHPKTMNDLVSLPDLLPVTSWILWETDVRIELGMQRFWGK